MILFYHLLLYHAETQDGKAGCRRGLRRTRKTQKEKSPAESVLPNATQKPSSLIHHTITTRAPLMEVNRGRDENDSLDVIPMIERERGLRHERFDCFEKLAKQIESGGSR